MKIIPTKLTGVYIIETILFEDERGNFTKTFNEKIFKDFNLETDFKESFYSVSKKDVIRGMHFHLPPKDHAKLVYVTKGTISDVVLDLRKNSKTYGESINEELSNTNNKMIYIPSGCAHGFLSKQNDTCVVYLQTGTYSKDHDDGVHFDSFGMNWGVIEPIVSERDMGFKKLNELASPFNI